MKFEEFQRIAEKDLDEFFAVCLIDAAEEIARLIGTELFTEDDFAWLKKNKVIPAKISSIEELANFSINIKGKETRQVCKAIRYDWSSRRHLPYRQSLSSVLRNTRPSGGRLLASLSEEQTAFLSLIHVEWTFEIDRLQKKKLTDPNKIRNSSCYRFAAEIASAIPPHREKFAKYKKFQKELGLV